MKHIENRLHFWDSFLMANEVVSFVQWMQALMFANSCVSSLVWPLAAQTKRV